MAQYIGVDGVARYIRHTCIGVNGVAKTIGKGYVGVDGVARQFLQDGVPWYKYGCSLNIYEYGDYIKTSANNKIGTTSTFKMSGSHVILGYSYSFSAGGGYKAEDTKLCGKDSFWWYRYYVVTTDDSSKVYEVTDAEFLEEVTPSGTEYSIILECKLIKYAYHMPTSFGPHPDFSSYYGIVYAYDGKVPTDNGIYLRGSVQSEMCVRLVNEEYYYYILVDEHD